MTKKILLPTQRSSQTVLAVSRLALAALFGIGMVLSFPETYRAMQADSLFLWTPEFLSLTQHHQPWLTCWLTALVLQAFRYPWVAALIQATMAWTTAWLLGSTDSDRSSLHSGLIALLLTATVYLLFPFALQLQIELLLLALLWYTLARIRPQTGRVILILVIGLVGYLLIRWPLLVALLFVHTLLSHNRWTASTTAAVVAVICCCVWPHIYSRRICYIPRAERYLVWEEPLQPVWSSDVHEQENYHRRIRMAEEERWADLLHDLRSQKDVLSDKVNFCLALIAESAQGTLATNLPSYRLATSEDFFFRQTRDSQTCQVNRLFYRNLGIWDEAFHQAQEYYLLRHHGCCMQSLCQVTDYAIRSGDYLLAEKYLSILRHGIGYATFVTSCRQRISEGRATGTPEPAPLRQDNFVGGYSVASEMLRLVEHRIGHYERAFDYLVCALIVDGKYQKAAIVLRTFPFYHDKPLPPLYQATLEYAREQGGN